MFTPGHTRTTDHHAICYHPQFATPKIDRFLNDGKPHFSITPHVGLSNLIFYPQQSRVTPTGMSL
jgi:hypothetical protein